MVLRLPRDHFFKPSSCSLMRLFTTTAPKISVLISEKSKRCRSSSSSQTTEDLIRPWNKSPTTWGLCGGCCWISESEVVGAVQRLNSCEKMWGNVFLSATFSQPNNMAGHATVLHHFSFHSCWHTYHPAGEDLHTVKEEFSESGSPWGSNGK